MAISVTNWVWCHSRSRHAARLVLLFLADSTRTEGGWAWPSNKEIGTKAGISERAVQVAIKDLEKLGELEVQFNGGPKGCNRYRVICTPADSAPPQILRPADVAPPQDLQDEEESQGNGQNPADSASPAKSAPPQNPAGTPAESAPGTVKEPDDSTSHLKETFSTGDPDALFDSKPAKPKSAAKRTASTGTRIPDAFAIDDDMRAWAALKIPGFDIDAETENFIDYWRQRADKGALKADWTATWRTWMRRAATAAPPQQVSRNGNGSPARSGVGKQINYSDEEYASGW